MSQKPMFRLLGWPGLPSVLGVLSVWALGCATVKPPPLGEPGKITDPQKAVLCEKGTRLSRGVAFSTYTSAWCERTDGTRHGPYLDWWENGQKKAAGVYKDGRRDGTWTFFRETGEVDSQIEYRSDVPFAQPAVP